jgi:hypothetical protein
MKLKARRKVDARRFAAARAPLPNAILFGGMWSPMTLPRVLPQ